MTAVQAVEYLLTYACPSVQYRVRREILHEAADSTDMQTLQGQITALPKVKKAFACQRLRHRFTIRCSRRILRRWRRR